MLEELTACGQQRGRAAAALLGPACLWKDSPTVHYCSLSRFGLSFHRTEKQPASSNAAPATSVWPTWLRVSRRGRRGGRRGPHGDPGGAAGGVEPAARLGPVFPHQESHGVREARGWIAQSHAGALWAGRALAWPQLPALPR